MDIPSDSCPFDFSEHSEKAFSWAWRWQKSGVRDSSAALVPMPTYPPMLMGTYLTWRR